MKRLTYLAGTLVLALSALTLYGLQTQCPNVAIYVYCADE